MAVKTVAQIIYAAGEAVCFPDGRVPAPGVVLVSGVG
jgi:hypothetical protein